MTLRKPQFVFALLTLVLLGASGCSNVGNENPITPEMMEQGRQKENADRAGFKPDTQAPPATR